MEFVNHAKIQIGILAKKNEPVNDVNFVTGSKPIYQQGALSRGREFFLGNDQRVALRVFRDADDVAAAEFAG